MKDKELLLKDLAARLPYGVKCSPFDDNHAYTLLGIDDGVLHLDCPVYDEGDGYVEFEYCKPYLLPMSSMTKEERYTYHSYCDFYYGNYFDTVGSIDWLNAHHFDYRGIIPLGLAIEVTKENNPYK